MRSTTLHRSYHWMRIAALIVAGVLAIAFGPCAPTAAGDETKTKPKQRLDRFGDPLPDGARLRLGTDRFRRADWSQAPIAFVGDGDMIACFGGGYLLLFDTQTGAVVNRMRSDVNYFEDMAITPDGKRIVTVGYMSNGIGVPPVGALRLWDPLTLVERKTILWKERSRPTKVTVIGEGKIAATADEAQICLWDLDGEEELPRLPIAGANAMTATADGSVIAIADARGTIHLWEWKTKKESRKLEPPRGYRRLTSLAFSPDGKTLAVSDDYGDGLMLLDVATGKRLRTLTTERSYVTSIVFTPDGKHLITADRVNTNEKTRTHGIYLWDVATGKKVRFLPLPGSAPDSVALSRDGGRLAVASGSCMRVWDAKTWKELAPDDTAHRHDVTSIAFSKTGLILTGSHDGTCRLWDLQDGRFIRKLDGGAWVRDVALTPDGKRAAGLDTGDQLIIWDTETGKAVYKLPGHSPYGQHSVIISDDGKRVVSFGSGDLFLRVTNLDTGKAIAEHAIRPEGVEIADPETESSMDRFSRDFLFGKGKFTPDGKLLLFSVNDGQRVFEVATGKELRRMPGGVSAISPDSRLLLTVQGVPLVRAPNGDVLARDATETVRAVKIEDGEAVGAMSFRDGRIRSVACAADGKHFAAATLGKTPQVHLCKLGDDKPFKSFDLPALPSFALAFSPDGKSLAVAMTGGSVLVYDVPVPTGK